MTRNSFVKLLLTLGSTIVAPFVLTAKSLKNFRIKKGSKVDAGKDPNEESISLHEGDVFFCKLSTNDTDGDLYIFESTRGKKVDRPFIIILSRTKGGISWKENFYLQWATKLLQRKPAIVYLGPAWFRMHLQK
jgi:hypothetical protein